MSYQPTILKKLPPSAIVNGESNVQDAGEPWMSLEKGTTVDEVNAAFKAAAADGPLAGRLFYSEDPIVSSDIQGSPASCTFDSPLTIALGGNFFKIVGWYDNEWGYSNRLVDFTSIVAGKL